ncbi:hypothetical protein EVAR_63085_1 [Eumeta japonica]|uniref:Uncharacterized protein n=1 Tax=Eumeta variegata TaxID=151549 RepID=A0A4C1ZWZ4_EUMVA|nr:hypothetical protein EVAR_63085_1 [Eumeta japonica]
MALIYGVAAGREGRCGGVGREALAARGRTCPFSMAARFDSWALVYTALEFILEHYQVGRLRCELSPFNFKMKDWEGPGLGGARPPTIIFHRRHAR